MIATWAFYPPFDAPGRQGKVRLGLDLKGGVHLVLRVQTDDALKLETEMAAERLREALAQASIPGVTIATQPPTRLDRDRRAAGAGSRSSGSSPISISRRCSIASGAAGGYTLRDEAEHGGAAARPKR